MGIALLALVDLLSPLQSFASRWLPARPPKSDCSAGLRYASTRSTRGVRTGGPGGAQPAVSQVATAAPRPLRVVRTVDAQRRDGGVTGRLVLSGRLTDVCAELDRLAALEAAELSRSARTLH